MAVLHSLVHSTAEYFKRHLYLDSPDGLARRLRNSERTQLYSAIYCRLRYMFCSMRMLRVDQQEFTLIQYQLQFLEHSIIIRTKIKVCLGSTSWDQSQRRTQIVSSSPRAMPPVSRQCPPFIKCGLRPEAIFGRGIYSNFKMISAFNIYLVSE